MLFQKTLNATNKFRKLSLNNLKFWITEGKDLNLGRPNTNYVIETAKMKADRVRAICMKEIMTKYVHLLLKTFTIAFQSLKDHLQH